MARHIISKALLFALATYASAQGPPGGFGGGDGNPYSNGNDNSGSQYGGEYGDGEYGPAFGINKMIAAHAAAAAVAFALLFPTGGIMIRLLSFPKLWLVHGIFQTIAFIIFIAAAGLGVYMVRHAPANLDLMHEHHPIIGLVCLALLFLQPVLGFIHHLAFKKYSKRTFWSYAHIWIGRVVITLGIINAGFGLQLSEKIGRFAPPKGAIIGYAVVAGIIWVVYMASAIFGENKRRRSNYAAVSQHPPPYKNERARDSDSVQYA